MASTSGAPISPRGQAKKGLTQHQQQRRESLQVQLKSQNGTSEVLFQLLQILDEVSNSLSEEIQLRTRLETTFEAELLDLSERIMIEVKARENLKKSVEDSVKLETSLVTECELLRDKLRFLVDRTSFAIEDDSEEFRDLLGHAAKIEQHLGNLRELLDIDRVRVEVGPQLKRLHNRITNENTGRLELEARAASLESTVEDLLRKIETEKATGQELRKQIQAETAAREALSARLSKLG